MYRYKRTSILITAQCHVALTFPVSGKLQKYSKAIQHKFKALTSKQTMWSYVEMCC